MKLWLITLLVLVGVSNAHASIIGLLHPWPGNNITIRYVLDGKTPILEIEQENGVKCPVQLYRHNRDETFEATVANATQDKDGIPVVGFGFWINRPCFDNLNEEDESGPRVDRIDLIKDVFSAPAFAKFRNDFLAGLFKMRFGLQLPAGRESQQAATEDLNYKLPSGTILFQTKYEKSKFRLFDLKLTAPKPIKKSIELAWMSPELRDIPGAIFQKPKVTMMVTPLKLDLSLATTKHLYLNEEVPTSYYNYTFHDGKIVTKERLYQLHREGKSYCSVTIAVPEKFKALKEINLPAQVFTDLSDGSGGSGGFSEEEKKLHGLKIRYWSSGPSIHRYGAAHTEMQTKIRIYSPSCATPLVTQTRNDSVDVATAYRHLSMNGTPIFQFLTDYPPYQQGAPENYAPVEIDASKIPSGLSPERKPMRQDTPITRVHKHSETWRPKEPRFNIIFNEMVLPASQAVLTDLRTDHEEKLSNIYYVFAFKNRQVLSEAELEREAKHGEFCVMSLLKKTNEIDDVLAAGVEIPLQRLSFEGFKNENVYYGRGPQRTTDHGKRYTEPKRLKVIGASLNLHSLSKPEKQPYVEFSQIFCFNSKPSFVLRLQDVTKHIGVNGRPLVQDFLTNEIVFQK